MNSDWTIPQNLSPHWSEEFPKRCGEAREPMSKRLEQIRRLEMPSITPPCAPPDVPNFSLVAVEGASIAQTPKRWSPLQVPSCISTVLHCNRCKNARTLTPARAHQKKYAPPALYFSTSSSLSFLLSFSWRISTTNKNSPIITSPYNILNKRTDNQLTDIVEKLNAKWLSLSCECLPGGLPSRRVSQSRQLFEVFQSTWRYLLLFRRLHWHVEIALKYKIGRNTLGRLNDQKCFPASTVTKNFSHSLRSDHPTLQIANPSRY